MSSLAKSSAVMTLGTLVSRVLGLVKAMLLATAIGVTIGGAADAFDVANKVPNNLYMLLAGGILNAVLVPQIVRAAKQPDGGKDFTDRLLTLTIGLLAVFTMLATLAAPLLVRIYASSGWGADKLALATAFAYWCLPQVFFYGLYTLLGQVLNARESFGPYMWAPVLNNVVAIGGLALFMAMFGTGEMGEHAVGTWNAEKIVILAGTATLGVVAQALILIWPLYRIKFRYSPKFGFRGMGLGTAGKVASWTFAAVVIGQLGFIVTSQIASSASSTGDQSSPSVAAYSLAYLVFMLPHSLVAVSLSTALFTSLSKQAADNDTAAVVSTYSLGVRLVGLVNTFFTTGLIALAAPAAMVIGGGTQEQARGVGYIIMTMVVGLVPFSATYLTQRVFYAYEDAKTPFMVQLPQVVFTALGVLAAGTLPKLFIVAGIGAAMSLGYVLALALSVWALKRRLGTLDLVSIAGSHLKFLIAGVLSGTAGFLLVQLSGPEAWAGRVAALITCVWVGIVMAVIYTLLCMVLRVREVDGLVTAVKAKLGR